MAYRRDIERKPLIPIVVNGRVTLLTLFGKQAGQLCVCVCVYLVSKCVRTVALLHTLFCRSLWSRPTPLMSAVVCALTLPWWCVFPKPKVKKAVEMTVLLLAGKNRRFDHSHSYLRTCLFLSVYRISCFRETRN